MVNFFKLFMVIGCVVFTMGIAVLPVHQAEAKTHQLKDDGDQTALALNYHRVRDDHLLDLFLSIFSSSKEMSTYSVSKEEFERQIKWLKAHDAHFLTHEELIRYKREGHFPKRSVWINFDDMDESIYQNAFPILKKYNVPATGFVITGKVGAQNFHNLNLSTLAELEEMERSGLWTFQSHTHDLHSLEKGDSKMLTVPSKMLKYDLQTSNDYIDQHFNRHETAIAYPYGQIDAQAVKTVRDSGFSYGYTLEEKVMSVDDDNYHIPRILVSEDAFNQLVKKWGAFHHDAS
ncbi:TPA: intercellular adhesin biosynthesis polysaccharide N-deacetylase [Staphylococcus delphini]|nr:intercellular adhesin biosynthesis polysaccharide N-deacetylase [Staphylococcus delphini]HEC2150727.1 intercellular adhesin biosynthesis polysaccharide N-deacetylase [Staphylococcus delphini]HEC2184847.1 intercellular adhesin biosynthesis polysaccharide N-deacetylase [Staphylococcus delphini]HEC2186961.1 intercellular adhesin biosynthesis polysaccharide N-deacetylase [Staphylococcus delphini]HEC2189876.1 intercellular adhesin biosynthesis polysaccharide N-deacetylase [Staphylococcus delphini